MFTHILLIRWKPTVTPANIAAIQAKLESMRIIETVRGLEYGADLGLATDAHDFSVMIRFDSQAGWEYYRTHPVHTEASAFMAQFVGTSARAQLQS